MVAGAMTVTGTHCVEYIGTAVLGGSSEEVCAALHMEYLCTVFQCALQIVGDHYNRYALLTIQPAYYLIHFSGNHRVKSGNGLIEEKQFSCRTKRTGKQYTLLLTARQIAVAAVGRASCRLLNKRGKALFCQDSPKALPHAR